MSEFNRMTIVAAAEVISAFHSHSDMKVLEVQWGISGGRDPSSKSARVANLAEIAAADETVDVMTESGLVTLERALVETAIKAPERKKQYDSWRRFVAGLRFDGFEIVETEGQIEPESPWGNSRTEKTVVLRRMLPGEVPGLDFREAESEVVTLLEQHGFDVAKGHFNQALSAFQRGEWSSANGELRKFYESYLNTIAERLGYEGADNSKAKRDFLGSGAQPPFFLADYNEWDSQKTQFVQALMNRLHPHGGHPGPSDEEDATFRLQITLITARLFLRRFKQRKTV